MPDGVLRIPANTWFIGTANKDDSTYTITDKVYDRAITISFDDRNEEFQAEGGEKITLSYDCLADLFAKAVAVKENNLSAGEKKTFKKLTDFAYEKFDVTFGNRILRQIEILVPVYVACGGSKEDALDFLFSRKIVAKPERALRRFDQARVDRFEILDQQSLRRIFLRLEQSGDRQGS